MTRKAEIEIHDSLSNGVRELEPREPGRVGIYVCGPTVYGRIHVGNARPYVMFALLRRFLRHEGYDVTLVENVTDINDKIYAAARAQGVPSERLAREMTAAYRADTDRLELGRPDHEPLASETVGEIIDLISALIERGHAYPSDGDVYFSVRSFPEYGKLSNQRLEDLAPGEQGEPDEDAALKRDPLDFALWKAHKADEDTSWESPWGRGRPGWHIECSAMAETLLGLDFDVHGGGSDLVFPHHENEIAQSRSLGHPFAQIWTHNGMLRFTGAKMSKSAGDIVTIRDALDRWGREALLLFLMTGHWSKPIDFSEETMEKAAARLDTFRNALLEDRTAEVDEGELDAALADDFNTPAALAILHEWATQGANEQVRRGLALFGIAADVPEAPLAVVELAEEREAARAQRNFERADELRESISAEGWEVRDVEDGFQLVPK